MSTIVLYYLKSGAMKIFPRCWRRELLTRCQQTGERRSVKYLMTVRTLSIVTTRGATGSTDRYTHKRYW